MRSDVHAPGWRSRIVVATLAGSCGAATYACAGRERLDFGTLVNDEADGVPSLQTESVVPPVVTEATDAADTVEPPSEPLNEPPSSTVFPTANAPTLLEPVRGQIVDFWGHPVPNAELDVGGVRAVSASDGRFEASGVPDGYDLSLVVRLDAEAFETYGWTYQGLTTRTPVLPVYRGLPQHRATLRLELPSPDGVTVPCGAFAVDGTHGHQGFAIYQTSTPLSVVWRGLEVLPANVQSLFWEPAAADDCDTPLTFSGWRQHAALLHPGDDVTLALAGPNDSLPVITSQIDGVVRSEGEGALLASLFLRFANGATLPVASRELANDATFTFAAPLIEDTTLLVAASRSGIVSNDYAVDYRSYVGAEHDIELRPAVGPTLVRPAVDARVSPHDTVFEWQGVDGDVALLVVTQLDDFTAQFVVTASTAVQLPDLSHLGLTLAPEAPHAWGVEVHRIAPTVDEWLEGGLPLAPFSTDFNSPVGPAITSGSFARSGGRGVSFEAP